jgi:lipoprotein-releasing system permease protein
MIVVNSVMSGFQEETYKRLHGILSDLVVESHGLEGIQDPSVVMAQVRDVLGDDLEAMTANVHVPAMLHFELRDRWFTKQVNLIGIDKETYADVGDFGQYLLHPENREKLTFGLKFGGYDERLKSAGWAYRRDRALVQKQYEMQRARIEARQNPQAAPEADTEKDESAVAAANPTSESSLANMQDPFAELAPSEAELFDPFKETHTGIVLGIALASERMRNAEGEVVDYFLCRPGDDVKVTFPTTGMPPKPASSMFTIVDLYESKMSEYDATFAFMPIEELQRLRGMIDPASGVGAVSAIQIRLRPEADLYACREKLRERFPPTIVPFHVQSWKDMQGPLLAAVQMETTILNILLFLIIGVAGFGILATFYMIVVEKTRDIGILKSLGASSRGVMSIFLGYGMSLGMVGSGVGVLMGLLFVWNINEIAQLIENVTGREVFDPTIYYFQEIPTIINPFTIGWIVLGAMTIAVGASVLPAIRAARLHPVEALRYE